LRNEALDLSEALGSATTQQRCGAQPTTKSLRRSLDHLVGKPERARFRLTGRYGMQRGGSTLLWLDIGRLDHLGPLVGFFDDKLAELGGRAHKRRAT
jgi:hypothetical protein